MGRADYKVTVVTGGALGIGRAISELFAQEGARVIVTDILDEPSPLASGRAAGRQRSATWTYPRK